MNAANVAFSSAARRRLLCPGDGTSIMGETPASRRRTLVSAIMAARGADEVVSFRAGDDAVVYEGRTLRLEVGDDERPRLEALLEEYHALKIEEPATRKAEEGVVYLSAVTDPKHAADFVEALFRQVYGADEDYKLQAERRG